MSSKTYSTPIELLKGSIVLCQHGYTGSPSNFNKLFNNIGPGSFAATTSYVRLISNVLKHSGNSNTFKEENSSVLDELKGKLVISKERNYFIKTGFSNSIGAVVDQVEELNDMVDAIHSIAGDLPIILLGHSKGGLVNMQFAIKYSTKVCKLISVGTPYNLTSLGFIQARLGDIKILVENSPEFKDNIIVLQGIKKAEVFIDSHYEADLGSFDFYDSIKSSWNSFENKPKLTVIAGNQIGWSDYQNMSGDLTVGVNSQLAKGYLGITHSFEVKSNYIIVPSGFINKMRGILDVFEFTRDLSETVDNYDNAMKFILGIILTFFVPDNLPIDDYDLIHTKQLGNFDVSLRILAGLNA